MSDRQYARQLAYIGTLLFIPAILMSKGMLSFGLLSIAVIGVLFYIDPIFKKLRSVDNFNLYFLSNLFFSALAGTTSIIWVNYKGAAIFLFVSFFLIFSFIMKENIKRKLQE